MDRAKRIFGNKTSPAAYKRAVRTKEKYQKKYGSDKGKEFFLAAIPAQAVGEIMGVRNLILSGSMDADFSDKSIIIGSTRMGFSHYRIALAMASAAYEMGYEPFFFDLHSFQDSACGKIISRQNKLYSMGIRLSQRNKMFSSNVWEPLTNEGMKKLACNAADQKTAELMTAVYQSLPKDIPFIASHVWAAQAAVHAGMTNVINAVPGSLPMAMNLAEGALHTVQTPSAYIGYRALRDMENDALLKPMPAQAVRFTGHYIDHEIASNISADCKRRQERAKNGAPKRWLLSLGGSELRRDILINVVRRLMSCVRSEKAALIIDAGDNMNLIKELYSAIPELRETVHEHFDDFSDTAYFAASTLDGDMNGLHIFYHADIFPAVYTTNVLMRTCDILITQPDELAYYPVPKLIIGGGAGFDESGAARSAEIGDGTYLCRTPAEIEGMLRLLQNSNDILANMCRAILRADKAGIYSGAYNVVKLAVKK